MMLVVGRQIGTCRGQLGEIGRDSPGDEKIYGDISLGGCRLQFPVKGRGEADGCRHSRFFVDLGATHDPDRSDRV
jgi:hypothetical protein